MDLEFNLGNTIHTSKCSSSYSDTSYYSTNILVILINIFTFLLFYFKKTHRTSFLLSKIIILEILVYMIFEFYIMINSIQNKLFCYYYKFFNNSINYIQYIINFKISIDKTNH